MSLPARSATAETIQTLRGSVIPALNLARAGLTGIGVPGIEGAVTCIFELAKMVSTMKGNKKALAALKTSIDALAAAALEVPGTPEDLETRLTRLLSRMIARSEECEALSRKSRIDRFMRSDEYSRKILDIRNGVADDILEFTFHSTISIEMLVKDMAQKVNHMLTNKILARLKCSAARYNADNTPDRCMNGTRTDIITEIIGTLTAPPNVGQHLVILSGSAGSGKSTIAKSVASMLEDQHLLAASFFFSRDFAERSHIKLLPTTLACQLADYSPEFCSLLVKFLEEDRTEILSADPHLQFQQLVVELLAKMPGLKKPWIICLDALDECGLDRGQQCLHWILDAIEQLPVDIRFFLTGRPDVPQYLKFVGLRSKVYEIILDKVEASQVNHDIHLYIEKSLDGMILMMRNDWKTLPQDVDEITKRADGLFIFAATAVRYIISAFPKVTPQRSIDYLLRGATLTDLHDLYGCIVREAIPIPHSGDPRGWDYRDRATRVLATIIQLQEPLSPCSLAALLDINVDDLMGTLFPLSAVIHLPDIYSSGQIKIRHLSFRDFMLSSIQETRPDLLCGTEAQQDTIVFDIFRVLHCELRFNICDLPTSYLRNGDMPDIELCIRTHIPMHLQYACRFWAEHLGSTSYKPQSTRDIEKFLFNQFLFWLEIMSLLGLVRDAQHELSKLILWSKEDSPAAQFAVDAKRFITFFAEPIIESAPHIYLSALALAPTMSEVSQRFRSQFKYLVSIVRGQMSRWPAMVQVLDHGSTVSSVAFSPDGKKIVSGSYDNTLRIWDAETGEALGDPLEGHTAYVHSVAFSPDGKKIVSGSDDTTVRIWDANTGEMLGSPLEGHTDTVLSVAFSPNGKKIVSGSGDTTVRIWDAETGEELANLPEGSTVLCVAFSPDGKKIVSGSSENTVQIWDTDSCEPLTPFEGHTKAVQSVAFSPNGRKIVSGSYDETVRLWDANTGEVLSDPLQGHTDWVRSVAFSPDGKRIVSGSDDKTLWIWDAETGEALGDPLQGHTNWVLSVVFSPDGKRIVSGSDDTTIRVWDAEIGETLSDPVEGHTKGVQSVTFSPNGKRIVSGSDDNTVCLWDAETGEALLEPFKGHIDRVRSVAFSPDGKKIVSGSDDNTIRIWDAETGEALGDLLQGHTDCVWSVAFSPDGKRIVSGSDDKTVRIWDAETGEALGDLLQGHTDGVRSVSFSPDSMRIVSGSCDETVQIWNADTGKAFGGPLEGHTYWVQCVAFSPNGKMIVSGSYDETVRIWDADTGEALLEPFKGHTDRVRSVAFSPDGKKIVSGSDDNTIQIWDVETGEALGDLLQGHTDGVRSVAFSPDGKKIVSSSDDKTVRIWDEETGEVFNDPLQAHTDWGRSGSFSPDSKSIVSCSSDETAQVWPADTEMALSDPFEGHCNYVQSECSWDADTVKAHSDPYEDHTHSYSGSSFSNSQSTTPKWYFNGGWAFTFSQKLLLWLPSTNRQGLWTPNTKLVIGRTQTLISFENSVHGTEWKSCYIGQKYVNS